MNSFRRLGDVFTQGGFPANGLKGEGMGGLREVINPRSYRDQAGRGKAGLCETVGSGRDSGGLEALSLSAGVTSAQPTGTCVHCCHNLRLFKGARNLLFYLTVSDF